MRIIEAGRDPDEQIESILLPPYVAGDEALQGTVAEIIANVRQRGEEAVIEYGRRYDYEKLDHLEVTDAEIQEAYSIIPADILEAIRRAIAEVRSYHEKQMRRTWMDIGIDRILGQIVRPISRVGVYAPAGLAPLPSTVVMCAVPAAVAGVKDIILCCPPQKDGRIHAPMLVAAREIGIRAIYKAGGAQAIAAMAFGTESIPAVDKIVGPGNPYVTEAKRQVFGLVGIDMLAGPSEVVIIADESARPDWVAADLLAQAEHSPDARSILITASRPLADGVLSEVRRMRDQAPRSDIIRQSLSEFGAVILARDMDEAISLANRAAPEHLEIMTKDPWAILSRIENAGAIFIGPYSPVAIGDYAAGPSHTLPTGRTARFSSALGVDDFLKTTSIISFSRSSLRSIADTVIRLAAAEGMESHAESVRIRD